MIFITTKLFLLPLSNERYYCCFYFSLKGEHQYEILDFVAAKFHEELGIFKLLVGGLVLLPVVV